MNSQNTLVNEMEDEWLEIGKEFIAWLKQKTGYMSIPPEYVLSFWAKYGQEFSREKDNARATNQR